MEELFPSEIARLVLGYLKESKCEKSWKIFLEESSNLHEYCELYNKGKLYSTNVNGKSLLDILNEYCILKKDTENNCNNEFLESAFKEKYKIMLEEMVTNAAEHVLLKYFPSICDNNHLKNSSAQHVTKAICTSEVRTKNCIEYENIAEKGGESASNDHIPKISSHNFDSSIELNVTDHNVSQPQQCSSGVSATSLSLSIIESSVSDSIYLQDIVKVEKDNDSFSVLENSPEKNMSDIRCDTVKQNELSNNFSECYKDLNSSKNCSKQVMENICADSMEVEIIKTVKVEPCSEVNSNKTTGTNCLQNSSIVASQDGSTVEINQTALCDTQSTVGQFSNLVNNISFSTNQSGYTLQPSPYSNQPVAVNDLSFSSVPTYIMPNYPSNTPYMQNNAQYSFVINTPTPWKEATVGGFSLNLPNIHTSNIGPVLTSIDSISSNSTSSVPTVCVNDTLNPALTTVNPVISGNDSSVTGVSVKTIPSTPLTTVNAAASGQPRIVSSGPSNVSSFVNTVGTVQTVPNSNSVTSDKAKTKSNEKLRNKNTSGKKSTRRRNKSEFPIEKKTKNNEVKSKGKGVGNKRKRN